MAGDHIELEGQINGQLRSFGEDIKLLALTFGSEEVREETVVIYSIILQNPDT